MLCPDLRFETSLAQNYIPKLCCFCATTIFRGFGCRNTLSRVGARASSLSLALLLSTLVPLSKSLSLPFCLSPSPSPLSVSSLLRPFHAVCKPASCWNLALIWSFSALPRRPCTRQLSSCVQIAWQEQGQALRAALVRENVFCNTECGSGGDRLMLGLLYVEPW